LSLIKTKTYNVVFNNNGGVVANFSDFIKNSNNETNVKKEEKVSQENMEELINKYSKLDNNSLMKEFIKMTIDKKKKGELSNSEINSIKSAILPYLNTEQVSQLEKLLDLVENV